MKKTVTTTLAITALAIGGTALLTPTNHVQAEKNTKSDLFEKGIINSFKSEQIQVGDHSIHYEIRQGKAKPDRTYVLSHGLGGTTNFMKVVASDLAKAHPNSRIILVDQAWHGQSTGPKDELKNATVDTYANVMVDFIKEMKDNGTISGKLNWTGWSMGGSIGLLLDLKGAGLDELTLLNSGPYWKVVDGWIDNIPALTNPASFNPVFKSMIAGSLVTNVSEKDKADILSYFDNLVPASETSVQDVFAVRPANFDVRDQLSKIKAKTLIINGSQDVLTEQALEELMDEQIKDSKLVTHDDTHMMLIKPTIAKAIVDDITNYYK